MFNENVQAKMESVWQSTIGSWQNCTKSTVQSFLSQCLENNIDPQYCMSWVEQHKAKISDWSTVSKSSLDWMNQHTSTGSPITYTEQD